MATPCRLRRSPPGEGSRPIVVDMRESMSKNLATSDSKPPTLLILVGPKGSGKTHIGTVIARHLGVRFLRVEPIFLAFDNGPGAVAEVRSPLGRQGAKGAQPKRPHRNRCRPGALQAELHLAGREGRATSLEPSGSL